MRYRSAVGLSAPAAASELAAAPRERFQIERFLLNVFFELGDGHGLWRREDLPDWLCSACEAVRDPGHFRSGLGGFLSLEGRWPEHVARMMRLHMNTTPSDYLNDVRLNHAALQLETTDAPVTQIAFDCGYENLSHCFHRYRRRFGRSPGAYGAAKREDII